MDKVVLWTVSACSYLKELHPSKQEKQQIKETLSQVIKGEATGHPVPFNQHPGELVITSGRFALIYRPAKENIVVTGVEPCDASA